MEIKLTIDQQIFAQDLIIQHLGASDAIYKYLCGVNFFELTDLVGISFSDLFKLNEDLNKKNLYLSSIFSGNKYLEYRITINNKS